MALLVLESVVVEGYVKPHPVNSCFNRIALCFSRAYIANYIQGKLPEKYIRIQ